MLATVTLSYDLKKFDEDFAMARILKRLAGSHNVIITNNGYGRGFYAELLGIHAETDECDYRVTFRQDETLSKSYSATPGLIFKSVRAKQMLRPSMMTEVFSHCKKQTNEDQLSLPLR